MPLGSISAKAPEGSLVLIEVTKKYARVFRSIAKGRYGTPTESLLSEQ